MPPKLEAFLMGIVSPVINFLKEVQVELSKVVWPTREETIRMTIMVVMVTLFVGFFIGGIDYLLTQLTQLVLR